MEVKQGLAVRFSGTFFSHLVTRVYRTYAQRDLVVVP